VTASKHIKGRQAQRGRRRRLHLAGPPEPGASKIFLTSNQLRVRYGNRSEMFLTRIMQSDPSFPRPIMVGRFRLWALDEVEEYERALAARRELMEAAR
jgi:hypothetical protein